MTKRLYSSTSRNYITLFPYLKTVVKTFNFQCPKFDFKKNSKLIKFLQTVGEASAFSSSVFWSTVLVFFSLHYDRQRWNSVLTLTLPSYAPELVLSYPHPPLLCLRTSVTHHMWCTDSEINLLSVPLCSHHHVTLRWRHKFITFNQSWPSSKTSDPKLLPLERTMKS